MDRRGRRLGRSGRGSQKRLKAYGRETEIGPEAFRNKELKVSLSGNLGFVSLDEVLRLLIRSGQRGCVSVRGNGIDGRVFVTRGGISLATTMTDEGLETLFRKSQLVDPGQFSSGSLDSSDGEVIELIREVTVESIYRLNLHGESFDVAEGAEARYGSPRPFELEQTLESSRKRLEDWAEVSQVVSNLDARISFLRDLGDREEVKIRRDAWKVLSEVGAGASVTQIARELGTTEFWAARVVARLVQDDLLKAQQETAGETDQRETGEPEYPSEPEYRAAPEPEPVAETFAAAPEPTGFEETEAAEPGYDYTDEYRDSEAALEPIGHPEDSVEEDGYEPVAEPEPVWQDESLIPGVGAEVEAPAQLAVGEPAEADDGSSRELDPDRSWWEEPEDEAAEPGEEGESEEDVEEDTEAFLEKVFSELDSSEEGEEEGYGLLRRRRLGAMRDIARDS